MPQPFRHEEPNDIPLRLANIDKNIDRYNKHKNRAVFSRFLAAPALKNATLELNSLSRDLSGSTLPTAPIARAEIATRQLDLDLATPLAAMSALRASIRHIKETHWGEDKLGAQAKRFEELRQLVEIEGDDDDDTPRHLESVD